MMAAFSKVQKAFLNRAIIESLIAATIAFLLSIFMLGLRSKSAEGGLVLEPRFSLVASAQQHWFLAGVCCCICSGGTKRLLLSQNWFEKIPLWLKNQNWPKKYGNAALLFACFALPMLLFFFNLKMNAGLPLRYWFDIAILILTYIMLGWGLNIVVGLAGLLDLGYVAFYAVGAYSYALLAQHFGLSFWLCLPLAGLLAASWGVILGFPVLRLRGDYLAIVTLAFGEMVRIILLNWYQFTGGPDGISGIPRPSFFGLPFKRYGEQTFHTFFRAGLFLSAQDFIPLLYHFSAGALDQLCHPSNAPPAHWPRLGGFA